MGIGPEQKEFEELTKSKQGASDKRTFYHEGTGKILDYSESKTGFLRSFIHENAPKARVLTIWEEGKKRPSWAILTNEVKKDAEALLREYMSQWPYLGEILEQGSALGLGADRPDLWDSLASQGGGNIFSDFVKDLHQYCQKHFFPYPLSKIDLTHLVTNIYSYSGRLWETEDSLTVALDVPERAVDHKDLGHAVKMVNERHILDYSGRRLWLQI